MNELDDYAIKKVAKGGFFIFISILLSFLVFLFYKVLAARYLGPADYGTLTLGITILNIASLFGLAGMHHSIGKFINHYLATKQYNKVKGIFVLSFLITTISSIVILSILYLSSNFIGKSIFKIEGLEIILKIFAIGVPFSVLTQLLKYYFFAFKKPEYAIVSESLSEKMLNLIFLIFVIYISASLYLLSWMYILSLAISTIVSILILRSITYNIMKREVKPKFDFRNIISFSLPLMLTGILGVTIAWTDTIFIGILRSDVDVGIYNAAYIIASALMIFWLSFGDIFYPIISELYSKKAKNSIRKIFEVASRWIFIITFPIFIIILTFSSAIISILFGQSYQEASAPLSILAIGYFLITIFGLSEQGLRTFKKTKFLWAITSLGFLINIVLNIILIFFYGIIGAAVATTFSILFITLSKLFYFKRVLKFSYNKLLYFKFISSSIIAFTIFFYSTKLLGSSNKYIFLLALIAYIILYFALLIIFKSFSDEDIKILEAIERKIGLEFVFVKKYLNKYGK